MKQVEEHCTHEIPLLSERSKVFFNKSKKNLPKCTEVSY